MSGLRTLAKIQQQRYCAPNQIRTLSGGQIKQRLAYNQIPLSQALYGGAKEVTPQPRCRQGEKREQKPGAEWDWQELMRPNLFFIFIYLFQGLFVLKERESMCVHKLGPGAGAEIEGERLSASLSVCQHGA